MGHTILITGASGYLGSAISVDLARDHLVIGVCRREPALKQRQAAPRAIWEKSEIIDVDCIESVFKRQAAEGRRIDYVLHFAAFTDYDDKWQDEYCDTNVIGTRNIIEVADHYGGVQRIVFAASIAALTPPRPGELLTEKSPAGGTVAYCKSKAMGEALMAENVHRVPAVVLRIGGVFTDWCELPPPVQPDERLEQALCDGKGGAGHGADRISVYPPAGYRQNRPANYREKREPGSF